MDGAAPRGMTGLTRAIRLPHATALVVGTIVGASIFVQPSEVTSQVHSVRLVLLVWLVAGLLTLLGSLVCAELASYFTRTGGVYVYLSETLHPSVGFLWGWAMLVTMHTGIIAAIATVLARYVGAFVPLGTGESRTVAVAAIVLLSAVNYVGVKQGSRLQTGLTVVKLLAVVILVGLGALLGGRIPVHLVSGGGGESVSGFLRAVAAGLFAFGGWHMVTYSAEETVEPERTIPRALIVGTLLVTFVYVAMNAVYLYVLPIDRMAASTRVAAEFADALMGSGGAGAISVLVIVSTLGALTGIILAGPRVFYAMARESRLPAWLGALHPAYGTPHRAIILQAAVASLLVVTGTFRALFTRVVYTEWIFFGLLAVGLIRLNTRAGYTPRYRMWGYPVTPLLFAVMSFAVAGNALATNWSDGVIGLGVVLVGVLLYPGGPSKQPVETGG